MAVRRRGWMACLLLSLAIVVAGCGGNDDEETADDVASPAPTPTVAAPEPEPTPTPEGETYVVEQGDTLGSIALRFGTTTEAIVEANDLDDPDTLAIGDELVIPEAEEDEADVDATTTDPAEDATEEPAQD